MRIPVFHWMLEFPEVFYAERPDPLDDARVNRAAYVDGFVGNPPFMGGMQVSGEFGPSYAAWLLAIHERASGNADLVAHFFRRAASLLGQNGTLGMLATNTIAQGDTRETGLKRLLSDGWTIFEATRSMPWPGAASVAVSAVHLALGSPVASLGGRFRLDGARVGAVSSRLRGTPERKDPSVLWANRGFCFFGATPHGSGFFLEPDEHNNLLARNARNGERTFAYIGGEDVNRDPKQNPGRFIINFGNCTLEEAESWPDLLRLVRERVKPFRDELRSDSNAGRFRKKFWWRFAGTADDLVVAVRDLNRCLVAAQVSKHLCFCFQPTNRVFSKELCVLAFNRASAFAVLQSRIHECWTRLLSSSLEDRLRYAASDCFHTFPFPNTDPLSDPMVLEDIGETLHDVRAVFMIDTQQGLTQTYNLLKDPNCAEPRIIELRRMHEEMDRAVLEAYGWDDLPAPPYCTATPTEQRALEAFNDEVIDRLFVLNAERAEEERRLGLGGTKRTKRRTTKTPSRGKREQSETDPKQETFDLGD
jgi:hypothetical protein